MTDPLGYIISYLLGAGSITGVAIWVIRNRDTVWTLLAWFHRTFAWISKRQEYGNVAYNIESVVNKVGTSLEAEAPDVLPYPMKIEWARTAQDVEATLRQGEIVVLLDYSPNRERNLVTSTLAYIKKGLLPRARPYTERRLMVATDFTLAKTIFQLSSHELAVPYFFENFVDPATKLEPELRDDLARMDRLQERGLFSRVFLRELKNLGERSYPATPCDAMWQESRAFSEYLDRLARKEKGEDVPGGLTFAGSKIRVAVMLVARSRTRIHGIEPYLRRVQIDLDRGVNYLYVLARTSDNIGLAEQIVAAAEANNRLRILKRYAYQQQVADVELNAVCIICALNLLMRPVAEIEPSGVLYGLLRENIKEIVDNKIEVVAIARDPGLQSKIAVRALQDGLDPIACCTSEPHFSALETSLGDEEIDFLQWSNNPESMIIASLYPLTAESVVEVLLDTQSKHATVRVDGWKARRHALGKGNQNQRLAQELTGWKITVEDVTESTEKGEAQAVRSNPLT